MKFIRTTTSSYDAKAEAAKTALLQREDLGFLKLPFNQKLVEQANTWTNTLKASGQNNLYVIGLGGSFLGAKAIISALPTSGNVHFLFSLDKLLLDKQLTKAPLEDSHFLIISKSGSTLETLSITNYVVQFLKAKNSSLDKHISVITEENPSPLFDFAKKYNIPIISHPKDVGGRFSVFSSVGVYPCSFAGINMREVFSGAQEALAKPFVNEISSYFYAELVKNKSISVFWPYNDRLYDFGLWLTQLWGESLTKNLRKDGSPSELHSTPILCIGTRDQHSLLQNLVEGSTTTHIVFFKEQLSSQTTSENYFPSIKALNYSLEDQLNASQLGTFQSLKEAGVESIMIEHEELSPKLIGELLMSFELVIGIMGELLNVNAYDQPGVERAKSICREILK